MIWCVRQGKRPGLLRGGRLLAAVLCLILALGALPARAAGSMANFVSLRSYDGRFADVEEDDWYYANVAALYELGLTNGQSDVSFGPVYEFSVYHLMDLEPDEICGLFPVEQVDWRTYETR